MDYSIVHVHGLPILRITGKLAHDASSLDTNSSFKRELKCISHATKITYMQQFLTCYHKSLQAISLTITATFKMMKTEFSKPREHLALLIWAVVLYIKCQN